MGAIVVLGRGAAYYERGTPVFARQRNKGLSLKQGGGAGNWQRSIIRPRHSTNEVTTSLLQILKKPRTSFLQISSRELHEKLLFYFLRAEARGRRGGRKCNGSRLRALSFSHRLQGYLSHKKTHFHGERHLTPAEIFEEVAPRGSHLASLQGYVTYKKTHPPKTLP